MVAVICFILGVGFGVVFFKKDFTISINKKVEDVGNKLVSTEELDEITKKAYLNTLIDPALEKAMGESDLSQGMGTILMELSEGDDLNNV